jgi:serine phosphatase RsbU (regulator of sigma subunit)
VSLLPNDLLVLATDGLTEARDRHGNVLDEAAAMRLVRNSPSEPQACADGLVSAIRRHSGGRIFDDLALLVVGIDAAQTGHSGQPVDADAAA